MTNTILFFPFTHITKESYDAMSLFFDRFSCLSLSGEPERYEESDGSEAELTCLRLPAELLEKAEYSFRQYLEWVKIHKGNEHNLKLLIQQTPYFKEDSQVSAIKSHLAGAGSRRQEEVQDQDSLQKSVLFLKAAHMCDEQNENIDNELMQLDKVQENMLKALRGDDLTDDAIDDELPCDPAGIRPDQGVVMPGERFFSWSECMASIPDPGNADPLILVTTSEVVFDFIESNSRDHLNALDIEEIKVHENGCENKISWQQAFLNQLHRAANGEGFTEEGLPAVTDDCSVSASIKINLFSSDEINLNFDLSDKQVVVCLIKLK